MMIMIFSLLFNLICFIIVISLLLLAACVVLTFGRSVTFMGLSRAEELELCETQLAGQDMAKLSSLVRKLYLHSMLYSKGLVGPADEIAEKIVDSFPNLHVGFALHWFLAVQFKGNRGKSTREVEALRTKAWDVARDHPTVNKPFLSLLPPANYPVISNNAHAVLPLMDDVWTCLSPFVPDVKREDGAQLVITEGFDNQATLIRNAKGDLMIVNPVTFDAACVDKINQLGSVSVIVSTSGSHGSGAAHCHALWPSALLYGIDFKNKHGKPELPWKTINLKRSPDQRTLFQADWGAEMAQLEGQLMRELYLYFPSRQLLTGPTDTAISTDMEEDVTYGMRLYKFLLGVSWPRDKSIGIQSYNNLFMTDYQALAQSLQTITGEWKYSTIVLGHGGIITDEINGLTARQQLRKAFEPVLRNPPSLPTRIGLIIRFLYTSGALSLLRSYVSFYVIPKLIDKLLLRKNSSLKQD